MNKIIQTIDAYHSSFLEEKDSFKSMVIIHDLMDYLDKQKELRKILAPFYQMSKKNLSLIRDKQLNSLNLGDLGLVDNGAEGGLKSEALPWIYGFAPLDLTRQELKRFNIEETKKEALKNLKELYNNGEKIHYDNAIKFLKKYIVDSTNIEAFKSGEKIININNQAIQYIYNPIQKTGILKIDKEELEFKKIPAIIINYFYELKNITKEFKTYSDFKNNTSKLLHSDEFRKKIASINKRVNKTTNGIVKEIIALKEKNQPKEINKYRWEILS